MTLQLIVKGTARQAARAAAKRRVPFAVITSNILHGETRGRVDDAHRKAVERWFTESSNAPFPTGALLHYFWEGLEQ